MRTLLIDGDIIVYKAGFAAEQSHEWEEGIWTTSADLPEGKTKLDDLVDRMVAELKGDRVVVALTHSENWRKELYPEYKANRKKVRKPVLIRPLREHLVSAYETFERPTLEADDVLGILATSEGHVKGNKVICSIDKDLLQIPGLHFNIDKKNRSKVTEDMGDNTHLIQSVSGDVVDNYPGCPGVGAKTAFSIVMGARALGEHPWAAIVKAYKKKGISEDEALVQARIARICRSSDYDFPTKTVRLWTPPSP